MMIGALPFMLRYNNEKGYGMKYFFYIFYPAHSFYYFISLISFSEVEMSKVFSEYERMVIKEDMRRTGSALLRKKGLRQVSVEEITKGANIAKGSFYSFYNSKEEFFWDIIQTEEHKVVEQILSVASQGLSLKEKIRKIFYDFYLDENNTIFYIPPADVQYIIRKLPRGEMEAKRSQASELYRKIFSACGIEDSRENIEIIRSVLELLRITMTNDMASPESTRRTVCGIIIEGMVSYFCKEL